jgi:RHS repeat-associated protein
LCFLPESQPNPRPAQWTGHSILTKQCSGAGDTYSYDGLGSVTSVAHADGTSIGYTYTGRATQLKDENGVTRISQVDGLGRLISVCEVSGASQQSVAPVACGQDIAATGFLTTYSYTTGTSNDQVTTITQGVQTRTFVTDSLGRTVSTTEPERGTTTYSYAYNGTGLVMTRKRPQANQTNPSVLTTTTTQYDSLGRVVSVSYSDGTPAKSFAYDKNAWVWSNFAPTNLKGRMYLASSQANANTTFSYDAMGRINEMAECTPSGCGNGAYDKHIVYSYDWAGNLTSEWDPAAGNITYGRSPAGEITSVTNQTYTLSGSSGSAALLSNAADGPNGPISYNLGNGLSEYNEYDSLGRINGGWVCIGAPSLACPNQRNGFALNWSGSRVSGATENYLGTLYYQYDDFNRLTGMENSALQPLYSYVYDRYGNRWQQNALQGGAGFSQLYTAATNQLSSGGYQYDAAGNMTYDASGGHHFTYDAEGNILQVDAGSWSFVFDAFNHRVRAQAAGVLAENLFDAFGHDTSGWSGPSTPGESHIFADNTQIALRSGDGETYFNHTNWLKTDRVHTDMNGATAAIFTSLPFGDGGSADVIEYYAGWDFQHFAGMDVDYWDSTYYAQFRNYSELQARWLSPDPYDGSYDASNPQSFNRYSYVLNNPLSLTDPSGLDYTDPDGNQCYTNNTTNSNGTIVITVSCVTWGSSPGQQTGPWYCIQYGNCSSYSVVSITTSPAKPKPTPAPSNAQNLQKDLKAVKTCATGSAGTAGAGAGLLAAGSNILSTGTKIGNFTPGTSVASQFFRAVLPQTIEATWAPTLLNPLATSSVLGGVVGRWVPVVGEALLIKSGVDFLNCVSANGDGFW